MKTMTLKLWPKWLDLQSAMEISTAISWAIQMAPNGMMNE